MLDIHELVVAFSKFANISFQEASNIRGLILAGAEEVLAKLKDGVDIQSNKERLVQAAAANAYCNYCMIKDLDSVHNMELDGIKIQRKSENMYRKAKEVKSTYMLMISDILTVSSAAFKGVEIDA